MSSWRQRILPLTTALSLLAVSVSAPAAPEPKTATEQRMSRSDVARRANHLVNLFASEISIQQGQADAALINYLRLYEQTRDPVVAERAVEIALAGHHRLAEQVLERWQRHEPTPSPEQKRMRWMVAAAKGDAEAVNAALPEMLAQTNRNRVRGVFLYMSQLALRQPSIVDARNTRLLHNAAARFPGMAEAAMADAIYSSQQNRAADATAALRRLSELDSDIRPATRLTLSLIARRNPEILSRFFERSNASTLSPMWQSLQVDSLIHSGREEEAYRLLQSLLDKNPDADLYIQAGVLSTRRKEPAAIALNYLDKAYLHGTSQQKSRAALFAAIRALEDRNFDNARRWNTRMEHPAAAFDKLMVAAQIETEAGNWTTADDLLLRAETARPSESGVYGESDLLRARLNIASKLPPTEGLQRLHTLYREYKRPGNERPEALAAILYDRAILYADRLSQPDKAVADLRESLALFPDNPNTLNALGYTMLSLPDPDLNESRRLIEQAHRLDPKSAAIQDSLGWVLFKQGDARAALPYLQSAYKEMPEAEVGAHLGEVLWSLGRRDEARAIWQSVQGKGSNTHVLEETLKRLGVELPAIQAQQ